MNLFHQKLILASGSPRRKQLLQDAGFNFTIFPLEVSEKLRENLRLDDQIKDIAIRKSQAAEASLGLLKQRDYLLLTADTVVVLDQEILGKPAHAEEAVAMLSRLSGRSHLVKTALCVFCEQSKIRQCEIESTEVFFRSISFSEIQDYVATGEPMDKAGAYGIQGLGERFVEKYVGPRDNVVGLPLCLLKKMLEPEMSK